MPRAAALGIAMLSLLVTLPAAAAECAAGPPRLELASGEVVDLATVGLGPATAKGAGELRPYIVAFDGAPGGERIAALEAAGAQVAGAIPPRYYLVRARTEVAAGLLDLPWVAAVGAFEPRWKLAPPLATEAAKAAPGERLRLEVVLYEGEGSERLEAFLDERGEKLASLAALGGRVVTVEVPAAAVGELAMLPEVAYVQPASEGVLFNNAVRVVMQTERAHHTANQAFYYPIYGIGVHGTGQIVAISDTGLRDTHEQFATASGKLAGYINGAPGCATMGDPHSHGTAVASTLAGDGPGANGSAGAPNGHDGLAFGGQILMLDIFDDSPAAGPELCDGSFVTTELLQLAQDSGAFVHNNSWGHMTPGPKPYGTYTWRSRELDLYLKQPGQRESVVVFAVGNEGGTWKRDCPTCPFYFDTFPRGLSEEAHAKNVLSVGGSRNGAQRHVMYLFSSRGPTNDCIPSGGSTCSTLGRIKPDLVAPASTTLSSAESSSNTAYCPLPGVCPQGYFGTSHAAPAVSAAAALVRDYFAQGKYPNDPSDPPLGGPPSSALIKAMLVNASVFLTDTTAYAATVEVGGTTTTYPNYDQGFGRPALDTVLEPAGFRTLKVFEDATTQVATGDLWSRRVQVRDIWQSACNVLRVSLAWTDEPGTLGMHPVLVNDLDLEVIYSGQTWRGNHGLTGGAVADAYNNVEDVFVPLGSYSGWQPLQIQVRVLGTRVMSAAEQPFAVVLTYGPCFDKTPCKQNLAGGCYQGPGDVVPGSQPPPTNGCNSQQYSIEECLGCGEEPWPTCSPPPQIRPPWPVQPEEPMELDPHLLGEPQ